MLFSDLVTVGSPPVCLSSSFGFTFISAEVIFKPTAIVSQQLWLYIPFYFLLTAEQHLQDTQETPCYRVQGTNEPQHKGSL